MNPTGLLAGIAISVSMIVGSITGSLFDRPNRPAHDPAVVAITGVYTPPPATQSPQVAPKQPTPTTTAPLDRCVHYGRLAVSAGWPVDQIPTLLRVMRAESGCNPGALGDAEHGGSVGLLQIHQNSWCRPNKYWPAGYLQTMAVLDDCRQLFDPFVNLYAGLMVWREGGWTQWTTY